MNQYTYYSFDTKQETVIMAESILDADKQFQEQTGIVALGNLKITTEIKFAVDNPAESDIIIQ